LIAEVRVIGDALSDDLADRQERLYLENQLARRHWILLRYPDLA